MSTPAPTHAPHTHWARLTVIGVALAAVVGVLVLAFLWPAATASVKGLPIALVGESTQTSALQDALETKSPGTFDFRTLTARDAAVSEIRTREIYGAIVLGKAPEVLTASAASPVVSQLLTGLAPALQAQLNAALAAQGVKLPTPLVVTVTDVVPLASTDSRGSVLGAASFPLVLGGMIGGIAISTVVVGVWRRVTALFIYSVVGGLAPAGILQGLFGALQGSFVVNAAAISLTLLGIGAVITGFVSIIGRPGIAVGPVLFLLVANPISSAATPTQFLAQPWGAVGQWFPPGAAATLLRDLSYFPDADVLFPWLVLTGWAVAGLLLSVVGHFRGAGAATRAALAEASA